MRGETMKDKSKKSTYSTTFGVDPSYKRGEKASYNISKSRFLKFSKKMHFCPKKFQQDRRPNGIRDFLSNTFVAYNKLYHKISIVNHCWDELI